MSTKDSKKTRLAKKENRVGKERVGRVPRSKTRIRIVIAIALLMGLRVSLCSVRCRNTLAYVGDAIVHVLGSYKPLKEWGFSPDEFDWSHTNILYSIEFSPIHARRHRVALELRNTRETEQVEKFLLPVCLQVSVYHDGVLYKQANIGYFDFCVWVGFGLDNGYAHVDLPEFSTADFPWPYSDKIRITVEMLNGGTSTIVGADMLKHTKLSVREGVPFE